MDPDVCACARWVTRLAHRLILECIFEYSLNIPSFRIRYIRIPSFRHSATISIRYIRIPQTISTLDTENSVEYTFEYDGMRMYRIDIVALDLLRFAARRRGARADEARAEKKRIARVTPGVTHPRVTRPRNPRDAPRERLNLLSTYPSRRRRPRRHDIRRASRLRRPRSERVVSSPA